MPSRFECSLAARGFALSLTLLLSGCAMIEKDNRRVVNWMEKRISPQTPAARVALAPPTLLVGSAGLMTDALVVNPAHEVPGAWEDVYKLYWEPEGHDSFQRSVLVVPCALLTPPTFVGDLALRSVAGVE
jgi:hypothetical protein